MSEAEFLVPQSGHYFRLFLFTFGVFVFVVFGLGLLVEVFQHRWEQARAYIGLFAFFAILAAALYYGPGRWVVIDPSRGISKPSILLKSRRSYISLDSIRTYSKIFSIDDDTKVVGIIVCTVGGEEIRYSDRWTPECSSRILDIMENLSVSETVPEKKYFG